MKERGSISLTSENGNKVKDKKDKEDLEICFTYFTFLR